MKYCILLISFFVHLLSLNAQIILPPTTLPDVGDILEYRTLLEVKDTTSYKVIGEDLYWSFDSLAIGGISEESYLSIDGTALGMAFPSANMIVNVSVFEAAAIKENNSIEIIGITPFDLSALGVETSAIFVDPFLFRKTPLEYGDQFEDDFDFVIQFSSELIPALDSITIPIPGATLDSIRITTTIFKSEEVTAWGQLNILGNDHEVLKVEQLDTTTTKIDLGLSLFGNLIWFDATAIFGNTGFNINQKSKTYKFLSADSKSSLIEFTERHFQDTSGSTNVIVSGRLSADLISSVANFNKKDHDLLLYPNPAESDIFLRSDDRDIHTADLLFFNKKGQMLMKVNAYLFGDAINVRVLPKGEYFMQILLENDISVLKILRID